MLALARHYQMFKNNGLIKIDHDFHDAEIDAVMTGMLTKIAEDNYSIVIRDDTSNKVSGVHKFCNTFHLGNSGKDATQ